MTYTAVNPHACCNWPRPEDAHAAACSPPHPHASPHLTNNDGLRWKTDGRPPANGPPTATPQQRRHSPSTPARGQPRPPTPRPSPQPTPPPSQSQGQVPITEQNLKSGGATASSHTQPCPGPGEQQGWRGGKGHDVHTGMTHSIVARQDVTTTAPPGHGASIITCASLFLGGEYPKGIWRKATFCFCKNK